MATRDEFPPNTHFYCRAAFGRMRSKQKSRAFDLLDTHANPVRLAALFQAVLPWGAAREVHDFIFFTL